MSILLQNALIDLAKSLTRLALAHARSQEHDNRMKGLR